jgi:uncharacterized protein (DUF736 family)
MRTLARTLSALLLAALVALVPATAASAAKQPKVAAWAKKHKLTGSWRAKDADKDGLKNFAEFKAKTNPRKADSDRDGLKDGDELRSANDPRDPDTDDDGTKDGAEHAGVVTAFDGDTLTLKQFNGGTLTAYVDGCDDADADDASFDDDADFLDEDEWEDLGDARRLASVDGEDELSCDLADVEEGDVLTSAELETRDGETYVVAVEFA